MPAVALSGAIVPNATRGSNEIILLDAVIHGRMPFDRRSLRVSTVLISAQNPWGRPRGVIRAQRALFSLTMKHSMAQRTPALTADQLTAKHLVTMSEHPLVMEQVSVSVELSAEQASSPPSPSAMTSATLVAIREGEGVGTATTAQTGRWRVESDRAGLRNVVCLGGRARTKGPDRDAEILPPRIPLRSAPVGGSADLGSDGQTGKHEDRTLIGRCRPCARGRQRLLRVS